MQVLLAYDALLQAEQAPLLARSALTANAILDAEEAQRAAQGIEGVGALAIPNAAPWGKWRRFCTCRARWPGEQPWEGRSRTYDRDGATCRMQVQRPTYPIPPRCSTYWSSAVARIPCGAKSDGKTCGGTPSR